MFLKRFLISSFFSVLLIFCCFVTSAQTETRDLVNKWRRAESEKGYRSDTGNVILLNQLSERYLYNNADSALYFAKQALQLAEYQKYILGQSVSLNNIGKTYYVLSDYASSLDASLKLMSISSKTNYQFGIAEAYQIMGLVYLAQDNYNQAIDHFNKGLDLLLQIKYELKAGRIYFNLALCYDELGQQDKAFYYLDKAIAIAKQNKDNNLVTMTLNRTGETYFHLKRYNKALMYYQQVIDSKLPNNWETGFAYSGMAQTYYVLGDYNKAILNAKISYELSKKVNSVWDAVRALEILSESYAAAKDYKNAYNYHLQLKKSNDSLFNSEKEKEINHLHLKQQQTYSIRLENDIKNKEQAIAFSKRLLFFRNLIAVAIIIFLIVIVISNRQKTALNKILQKQNSDIAFQKEEISKQKEVLDELNNTKNQLFSVISHDLRSPFAAILQTINLIRSGDIPLEEQGIMLEEFYQQVNIVTLMVNNLLVWANSQQSGIKSERVMLDVTAAVNEIVTVSGFLAKNKNINLYHQYNGEKMICADWDHVKIIMQNLIGNAIKFTPEGGTVEIYYTEDEIYRSIHVRDTGVGISPEKMHKLFKVAGKEISGYGTNNEAGAGIGLLLIKQFVDANDGRLDVQSKAGGSEFTVYLRKDVY
jgi:signal transduction histidine kinase